MKNILVTGGCGFIGSNFINYMLDTYNDITIVNVDKIVDIAPLNQIKVLSYKEKDEWTLETKYNIGKKRKVEE